MARIASVVSSVAVVTVRTVQETRRVNAEEESLERSRSSALLAIGGVGLTHRALRVTSMANMVCVVFVGTLRTGSQALTGLCQQEGLMNARANTNLTEGIVDEAESTLLVACLAVVVGGVGVEAIRTD